MRFFSSNEDGWFSVHSLWYHFPLMWSEDDVLMNLLITRVQTVLSTCCLLESTVMANSEIAGNCSGNEWNLKTSWKFPYRIYFFKKLFLDLQYFFGYKLLFVSEISMKLLFINDVCGGLNLNTWLSWLICDVYSFVADILSLQSLNSSVSAMHPFVLVWYFFLYLHASPVSLSDKCSWESLISYRSY